MKKSARAAAEPSPVATGTVLVAAFETLDAARTAAAGLPSDVEIVGTAPRPVPVSSGATARRVGSALLLGGLAGALVGALLALLAVTPAGAVLAGCVLLGAAAGAAGRVRPPDAGGVLVDRYELRAPAPVADALRDRLRGAEPAGLVELGSVPGRSRLAPAPLGALGSGVRTADEALGLTPH